MPGMSNLNNTGKSDLLKEIRYRPFPSDILFVVNMINDVLDSISIDNVTQEEIRRSNGEHIRFDTITKLRLIHAWLHEANRSALVAQFDTMNRK